MWFRRLLAAFLLGFVIYALPSWILSMPEVQKEIRARIAVASDANITMASVEWGWFPLPHLRCLDFHVNTREFSLDSSVFDVYPDWLAIISGEFRVQGIDVQDPDLLLKSIPGSSGNARMPVNWIKVRNGRFRPADGLELVLVPLKNRRLDLTGIYGNIEISGQRLNGRVTGNTGFASRVYVDFVYDLDSLDYRIESRVDHLDISKIYYKDVTTRAEFPASGFLDVEFNLRGRAMKYFKGRVDASSSCLVAGSKKARQAFSCGMIKAAFSYRPGDLSVDLEHLEFTHPRLVLHGKVRLTQGHDKKRLKVDMQGRDVDIGQVRETVLVFFRQYRDVRKVADIVRGGTASRISFHFDDEPAELESLHCMFIDGDVENVPVYIPDQHLMLDAVSGSVRIEQAVLYLKDATVRLRNSTGVNGSLVFGVADHRHELNLGIDLDADLADVKWALQKFVKNRKLYQELQQVTAIRGRAAGRLIMGDDQRHFDTVIDVRSVHGALYYQRLGWPVRISSGQVGYRDDCLSWKALSGKVGPHRVESLSGSFSWKHDDHLVIDDFTGTLDAGSLLGLFRFSRELQEMQRKLALDVTGSISIRKFRGSMPLDDPRAAKYTCSFHPSGLEIRTSMLPGPLTLNSGVMHIDNKSLKIRKCRAVFGGQKFVAALDLGHRRLQGWHGRIKLNGIVNKTIASWVRDHGWVPHEYFPAVPVLLKDFSIYLYGKGHHRVAGRLAWKAAGAAADLDINIKPSVIDIKSLVLQAGGSKGSLRLLLDEGEHKRLLLGWKGSLRGALLDKCLEDNRILKGALSGSLQVDYRADQGAGFSSLKGSLKARGLSWIWGLSVPLLFNRLDVASAENGVGINAVFRLFQDKISASGVLMPLRNRLMVHLDLQGDRLSDTVLKFLVNGKCMEDVKDKDGSSVVPNNDGRKRKTSTVPAESRAFGVSTGTLPWNLDIRGDVTFSFKVVEVDLHSRVSKEKRQETYRPVAVHGVSGYGLFSLGSFREVVIYGKSVCGLKLKAMLNTEYGRQERSLIIRSADGDHVNFEDFLPCMGWHKNVITGPFTVEMKLKGPDGLLSTNGTLEMRAKAGNIKKFGLLSRVLSVVNLVDLLSTEPGAGLIEGGMPYDRIILDSSIHRGMLHLDKAVIEGRGLNFYATGTVDIPRQRYDLIVFVAPLKTVDKIITSVPIIGAIIGGKHKSLITVPVKISGPWDEPEVRTLPVKAVTDVFKKLLFNVIKAPFDIISGLQGNSGKQK